MAIPDVGSLDHSGIRHPSPCPLKNRPAEEALLLAHHDLEMRAKERTQLIKEIEDRGRVQEAFREARDQALWLARFPDENPDPVIRVSADGKVLYRNPATVNLHDWKCAVGQPLDTRLMPLVSRAMAEDEKCYKDVDSNCPFPITGIVTFLFTPRLSCLLRPLNSPLK